MHYNAILNRKQVTQGLKNTLWHENFRKGRGGTSTSSKKWCPSKLVPAAVWVLSDQPIPNHWGKWGSLDAHWFLPSLPHPLWSLESIRKRLSVLIVWVVSLKIEGDIWKWQVKSSSLPNLWHWKSLTGKNQERDLIQMSYSPGSLPERICWCYRYRRLKASIFPCV